MARSGAAERPSPTRPRFGAVTDEGETDGFHGQAQDLEAKGAGDRVEGGAKQVGEQVKDAGKNVRDTFKR
jgi:hypothetical protein